MNAHVPNGGWPALVLNADFRPLSYYPLSLWSWQDAIKAVFLERVNIVAQYDKFVHSPSLEMLLPSVVSLKTYVKPTTHPAFTRFNVFLRDKFCCQFCGTRDELTFDHLMPRSRGGLTVWDNVVAACSPCNLRKGNMTPDEAGMFPSQTPFAPSVDIKVLSTTAMKTVLPELAPAFERLTKTASTSRSGPRCGSSNSWPRARRRMWRSYPRRARASWWRAAG